MTNGIVKPWVVVHPFHVRFPEIDRHIREEGNEGCLLPNEDFFGPTEALPSFFLIPLNAAGGDQLIVRGICKASEVIHDVRAGEFFERAAWIRILECPV